MFLGLVGAVVGGISLAATLLILSKLLRREFPRWIYPAAVGFGMISLTVYVEYSWFSRTVGELPAGYEVVDSYTTSSPLQPWTFIVPRVERFMVVNHGSVRRNEQVPNVVLVDVFLLERLNPTLQATQFLNCASGGRLLVGADTQMGPDGLPTGEDWTPLGLDNALVRVVCSQAGLPGAS
jgi:hypothetical protein